MCCDAQHRIGLNGADEIKRHPFFRQIDFESGLRNQKAPYIPEIKHPMDTSNFDPIDPTRLYSDDSDTDFDDEMELFEGFGHSIMNGHRPNKNRDKAIIERDSKHPQHAFFEFTFRRFFDTSGQAYPMKMSNTSDETEHSYHTSPTSDSMIYDSIGGQSTTSETSRTSHVSDEIYKSEANYEINSGQSQGEITNVSPGKSITSSRVVINGSTNTSASSSATISAKSTNGHQSNSIKSSVESEANEVTEFNNNPVFV